MENECNLPIRAGGINGYLPFPTLFCLVNASGGDFIFKLEFTPVSGARPGQGRYVN